jgi:Arc/MetJ-type ribon-helix-helix transcriptional regulator
MMSERLEVRIDAATMGLLKESAGRHGVSVGEVVRRALEALLAEEDRQARVEAAERLCSLEIEGLSDDWEVMEQEYVASIDEEYREIDRELGFR